jgi:glycosyltransferase involved in cell wall biosynthesis
VAPAHKLFVIPNGIEPEVFQRVSRTEARTHLGIEENTPVIGFVGRLEPQKGLSYLIEAVAQLIRDWPTLMCIVVGDGSLRSSLQRQAIQLDVKDKVHFLGYRPDVPALLPAFDIFVLPSLYEGLPYTILEAMAAGIPVIATDVAGTRDVVRDGETGLLVPPGDVPALREAIRQIFDNQELKSKLAQAGRQIVVHDFRLEDCVHRMEKLYQDVLSAKSAITSLSSRGGSA